MTLVREVPGRMGANPGTWRLKDIYRAMVQMNQ